MSKKILKGRISELHGKTAYWNSLTNFIPMAGEVVIYDDYKTITDDGGNLVYVPGVKVGTGNAYIQDIPFIGEDEVKTLLDHINNQEIHVGYNDRINWNSKLSTEGVINEELIFTNE